MGMKRAVEYAASWLFWRLPRLWMNRTAYAFWVMREKQALTRRKRARARTFTEEQKP